MLQWFQGGGHARRVSRTSSSRSIPSFDLIVRSDRSIRFLEAEGGKGGGKSTPFFASPTPSSFGGPAIPKPDLPPPSESDSFLDTRVGTGSDPLPRLPVGH